MPASYAALIFLGEDLVRSAAWPDVARAVWRFWYREGRRDATPHDVVAYLRDELERPSTGIERERFRRWTRRVDLTEPPTRAV